MAVDIEGFKNENQAQKAALVAGVVTVLGGIIYGMKTGKKFWYYVILILIIAPLVRLLAAGVTLKAE